MPRVQIEMGKRLMIRLGLCTAALLFALAAPSAKADDDILWRQPSGQISYWKLLDGKNAGSADIRGLNDPDWQLKAVADIDGDGAADLIWENTSRQLAYWSKDKPQSMITNSIDRHPGPDWQLAGAGDVNDDGTSDLIWISDFGQVAFWKMYRGARKERLIIDKADPAWRLVGVGDVDGSGASDLVWQSADGKLRYWRIESGQPIGTVAIAERPDGSSTPVGVGDVNGDGFADIIWQDADDQFSYSAMYDGQSMGRFAFDAPIESGWTFAGVGDVDEAPKIAPAIAPHPEKFAVPVETLTLAKGKGKFMETAFASGGFTFASSFASVDQIGPDTIDAKAPWRLKKHAQVEYRFLEQDGTALKTGTCDLHYKMWSVFFSRVSSLYSCTANGASALPIMLEVSLPSFDPPTNAMISFSVENADTHDHRYNTLRARMRYGDAEYEALPIGVDPKREGTGRRVASGFTIARDGALVGRIDFPPQKAVMMSFGDSLDRQSRITAPLAASDGREAVIFFAAQILKMPEASAE